jgi:hypothetical protein
MKKDKQGVEYKRPWKDPSSYRIAMNKKWFLMKAVSLVSIGTKGKNLLPTEKTKPSSKGIKKEILICRSYLQCKIKSHPIGWL